MAQAGAARMTVEAGCTLLAVGSRTLFICPWHCQKHMLESPRVRLETERRLYKHLQSPSRSVFRSLVAVLFLRRAKLQGLKPEYDNYYCVRNGYSAAVLSTVNAASLTSGHLAAQVLAMVSKCNGLICTAKCCSHPPRVPRSLFRGSRAERQVRGRQQMCHRTTHSPQRGGS